MSAHKLKRTADIRSTEHELRASSSDSDEQNNDNADKKRVACIWPRNIVCDLKKAAHSSNVCLCPSSIPLIEKLYGGLSAIKDHLPVCWDRNDATQNVTFYHHREIVKNRGSKSDVTNVARTAFPLPAYCGLYYFEVYVMTLKGFLNIGVTNQNFDSHVLYHWDGKQSIKHSNCMTFVSLHSSTFQQGDIVGCLVNFLNGTTTFTKNGYIVGKILNELPKKVYPTVATRRKGDKFFGNFGQRPFMYNFLDARQRIRTATELKISNFPLHEENARQLMQKSILSYLVNTGYGHAASAFANATGQIIEQPPAAIEDRKILRELVMQGEFEKVVAHLEQSYPEVCEREQKLLFKIKCYQLVELQVKFNALPAVANASPNIPSTPETNEKLMEIIQLAAQMQATYDKNPGLNGQLFDDVRSLLCYSNIKSCPIKWRMTEEKREAVWMRLEEHITVTTPDDGSNVLEDTISHGFFLSHVMKRHNMAQCAFYSMEKVFKGL